MARGLLKLFGVAAAFALVSVQAEQTIPDDESCDANDEDCALSLRQLRGELQAAEVQEHQELATSAEAMQMFDAMLVEVEGLIEGKEESESESQGACYGNWRSGFSYKMKTCALANGGQAAGTTSCLVERFGYKYGCAKCMGDMVTCGFGCLSECCTGQCTESAPCKACNKRKCAPGFTRCAGVAPP